MAATGLTPFFLRKELLYAFVRADRRWVIKLERVACTRCLSDQHADAETMWIKRVVQFMSIASFRSRSRPQRNHAVVVLYIVQTIANRISNQAIAHMLRSDVHLGKDPSLGAGLFDR